VSGNLTPVVTKLTNWPVGQEAQRRGHLRKCGA